MSVPECVFIVLCVKTAVRAAFAFARRPETTPGQDALVAFAMALPAVSFFGLAFLCDEQAAALDAAWPPRGLPIVLSPYLAVPATVHVLATLSLVALRRAVRASALTMNHHDVCQISA